MINYTLLCAKGHRFDAWFRDSASYGRQAKAKRVSCPICGNTKVDKAPMAPAVRGRQRTPAVDGGAAVSDTERVAAAIETLREYVETNATDVGCEFPTEARRMHYGETDAKAIYGEARLRDAKELLEEGIPCLPLPWSNRQSN